VRIDPKEVRERTLNNPDGMVLVADMNRDEHLTIKGHVGLLKIGTISGNARLDASGLVAKEIIITGDVNQHAVVKLNAPRGRVTIGGHIEGNARVTANAPDGEIMVAAQSGKLDDDAELIVVARDVDMNGRMAGRSRLVLTLTGGGRAAIGVVEGNAVVIRK
jgi:hypothetical protein